MKMILVKKVVVIQPLPTSYFRHLKFTMPVLAHADTDLGVRVGSGSVKTTNERM